MRTVIKLLADGTMVPIVLIAAYALLWRVPKLHRYDLYTRIFMAGVTSYMLAKIVGGIWQPEKARPFEQLGLSAGAAYLPNAGFPSDHTLFAAFLTVAVWFGTRNKWMTLVMAILTVLVSVGRVLAHVHTVLDVTGGIVFALIGALWYLGYAKKPLHIKLARKAKK